MLWRYCKKDILISLRGLMFPWYSLLDDLSNTRRKIYIHTYSIKINIHYCNKYYRVHRSLLIRFFFLCPISRSSIFQRLSCYFLNSTIAEILTTPQSRSDNNSNHIVRWKSSRYQCYILKTFVILFSILIVKLFLV